MVFHEELEEQEEVEKVSVRFAGDPDRRKPGELITYIMPHDEILKKYGPPRLNKYVLIGLLGNGKSITEIAKMFGVTGGDINNLINRYQIDYDKIKERNKLKEELQMREATAILEAMEKLPKDELVSLLESGKTTSDIANENGIAKATMGKLKRFYCLTPDTKDLANEFGYNKKMEHTFKYIKEKGAIKDLVPEGEQPSTPVVTPEPEQQNSQPKKVKITVELLNGYLIGYGVNSFTIDHIRKIAAETGNELQIVAIQAAKRGLYKSDKPPKVKTKEPVSEPDTILENEPETQQETAAAAPAPDPEPISGHVSEPRKKELLGTSFDGTAQEVSGALAGIQNFITSLNRKVEVEISVKEVS